MSLAQRRAWHDLHDDEVKHWRHRAEALIECFAVSMAQEGRVPVRAPAMPPAVAIHGGYIREPWRVLCYWTPEWSLGPHKGKWMLRVDTLYESEPAVLG